MSTLIGSMAGSYWDSKHCLLPLSRVNVLEIHTVQYTAFLLVTVLNYRIRDLKNGCLLISNRIYTFNGYLTLFIF